MKTLLLVRHAKSDWSDPLLADRDRPLNKRGKRDAPRLGERLRDERLLPDLIITSTAKRARKTAEAVAKGGAYEGAVKTCDALYGAGPDAYIAVLRGVPNSVERVMVIGHNPAVEELVQHLTEQSVAMPTAALAQIDLPIGRWEQLGKTTRGQLPRVWRPRE